MWAKLVWLIDGAAAADGDDHQCTVATVCLQPNGRPAEETSVVVTLWNGVVYLYPRTLGILSILVSSYHTHRLLYGYYCSWSGYRNTWLVIMCVSFERTPIYSHKVVPDMASHTWRYTSGLNCSTDRSAPIKTLKSQLMRRHKLLLLILFNSWHLLTYFHTYLLTYLLTYLFIYLLT